MEGGPLEEIPLEKRPQQRSNGRRVTCYDDRDDGQLVSRRSSSETHITGHTSSSHQRTYHQHLHKLDNTPREIESLPSINQASHENMDEYKRWTKRASKIQEAGVPATTVEATCVKCRGVTNHVCRQQATIRGNMAEFKARDPFTALNQPGLT